MKKRNRGIIAIVCIMALLISSFATYTAKTTADVDPSTLVYSSLTCEGGETIYYSYITNDYGDTPWYTDAGNTLQFTYGAEGDVPTVKINGTSTGEGSIVPVIAQTLVKMNPNNLPANSYTHVEITKTGTGGGVRDLYIKKGNPGGGETSSTQPQTTTSTPSGPVDYETLYYTNLNHPIYTSDHSSGDKLPIYYAVCEEESTATLYADAVNRPWTSEAYGDSFVGITWSAASPAYQPTKITLNGVDYTQSSGAVFDMADALVHINAAAEGGFHIGYNTVKVSKGDEYVTYVFRVGVVVAPLRCTATAQEGVPGSMNVTWDPGSGAPSDQVYRVYVDDDMKRGNLKGTSAVVNNIDAGSHIVKVVGYYLGQESDGPTATVSISAGVKYSQDISVEGFQIRSNYPDGTTPSSVAYRTMCKAPKAGSTVKAGGKTYTVASVGTIYALDTNTRDKDGTNVLDASYTLLNETPVTGQQYQYVGYRKYQGENKTFGYIAGNDAIISDYKAGDTDNTYYAFTMQNMDTYMANTIWVRPFVVANDSAGTIIYGKSTAYTSVAEIANVLYTNSMCKNKTSHNYLYTAILNNSRLQQAQNPFYRTTEITYGWNANLYIGFRKVPDSWNSGTGVDEGTYVPVGDWRIHNTSHYNETITTSDKKAAASYKGNTNDEMEVRVDNPGAERRTEGFLWNWGIQMKLANQIAYHRLEDGRKYRMTITYNTTKAGIMRIKTEGNCAAKRSEGYWQEGHDLVYDFDAVAGGNSHSVEFTYNKNHYEKNPGADPSIVICPGVFNVYPFGERQADDGTPSSYGNDCRAMLHVKYLGQYKDTTSTVEDVGGFPAGTIISNVDVTFTEIDDFAPDSPNVLH